MAITLNGVNLLCSVPEWDAWVAENISLDAILSDSLRLYFPQAFTTFFKWPGWNERRVECGKFFWPGPGQTRFAIGNFLATKAMVDKLQAVMAPAAGGLGHSHLVLSQVKPDSSDAEPETDDEETTVSSITFDVYMLPPRPLSGYASPPSPLSQAYLITVVDSRFLALMQNTGQLTVTPGVTTWANLLGQIATNMGYSLTVDTVNAAYLTPPASFNVNYENGSVFADGTAYCAGERIVFPLTGTTAESQLPATALALAQANAKAGTVLAGGNILGAWTVANLPNQINVIFPATVTDNAPYEATATVNSKGHAFLWTWHHPIQYTGSNSADLNALATQLATDLNTWLQPVCDVVFQGIVNVTQNALQDFEWIYRKKRVSLQLDREQVEKDATYPEFPDLPEWDEECDWYEDEVTTRVMPAPFLDFTLPTGDYPTYLRAVVQVPKAVTISSSQNNYTGFNQTIKGVTAPALYNEATVTAPSNLTGIDSTYAQDGTMVEINNTGTATLTLTHKDASSSAANQLDLLVGQAVTINPGETRALKYNKTAGFWRPLFLYADLAVYNFRQVPNKPAAISTNKNNYTGFNVAAAGGSTKPQLYNEVNVTSASTMSGVDSSSALDGQQLDIKNIGTSTLSLTHKDANSSGANQFNNYDAKTFYLDPGATVSYKYNTATSFWDWHWGLCPGQMLGRTRKDYGTVALSNGRNDNVAVAPNYATSFTSSGAASISGLTEDSGSAPADGRVVEIMNGNPIGGAIITLNYQDTNSTAANRIVLGSAASLAVNPQEAIIAQYKAGSFNRWVGQANNYGQNITGSGTQYQTTVWTGSTSLGGVSVGTANYVLMSNGAGAYPTYQQITLSSTSVTGILPVANGGTGNSSGNTSGNGPAQNSYSGSLSAVTTAVIYDVSVSNGIIGFGTIQNTGAGASQIKVTQTNLFSNASVVGPSTLGASPTIECWGCDMTFIGATSITANSFGPPYKEHKLEGGHFSAGLASTYTAYEVHV